MDSQSHVLPLTTSLADADGSCCGTGSDPKSLSVNIQMASDNLSYFLKAAGASAKSHIISLHCITVFCIFCWLMNSSELKKCYISLKGIKMSLFSARLLRKQDSKNLC